jgi:hypothetical protein
MADLTETAHWEPGITQNEITTRWTGGPDGNANRQSKQLANRTLWLKKFADELAAARGGKETLDERLDQYDAFEPVNMAALHAFVAMGLDLAGLAMREITKTISQRIQTGIATIINRGVISGLTVGKSATALRNISLNAGNFFMNGMEFACPAYPNSALVPDNYEEVTRYCYAYIYFDGNGQIKFACTPLDGKVPENGMALYRFSVPSGNSYQNDPYLTSVSMSDVRRVEAAYPAQFNALAYASVALPFNMLDAEYTVQLEILDYKGGYNQRPIIHADNKAANGFNIFAEGTLDAVRVKWTALKPSL